MINKVETKLKEAETQLAIWQKRFEQAQAQIMQWQVVRQVCTELLEPEAEAEPQE